MFRQKLEALQYHNLGDIDMRNDDDIKSVVVWLEDQKIRCKKIEDRKELRSATGKKWTTTFHDYIKDLECPYDPQSDLSSVLDWLLGIAVRYEFGDSCRDYHELSGGLSPIVSKIESPEQLTSALDMDSSSLTFKKGTDALATLAQVC